MLCTVWVQIFMSFVPPKTLNRIFPKLITGSLLLLVGVYLVGNGMQNWGGSMNCNGGEGFYALCPNVDAPTPLVWYALLLKSSSNSFTNIILGVTPS
jgi:xanthine/uracil permease